MIRVARRERELDLGLGDGDLHPLAMVLDGNDVRALFGEQLEELDQLARRSGTRVRITM